MYIGIRNDKNTCHSEFISESKEIEKQADADQEFERVYDFVKEKLKKGEKI